MTNLTDVSNPCMKCGSVQCAICSADLQKIVKATLKKAEEDVYRFVELNKYNDAMQEHIGEVFGIIERRVKKEFGI